MSSLIPVDFQMKKRTDKEAKTLTPKIRVRHNTVLEVDFKTRKVTGRSEMTETIDHHSSEFDFSNFNEVQPGSNFAMFTPLERMEYSEHVLKNLKTLPIQDVLHFANVGMVDLKKVSEKLGLPFLKD